MATTWITPRDEAHWLELRRQDITSTEASALFNMSPYETLFELWHRKAGDLSDPFVDNERIEAGRHIEPAIASLVSARYGVVLEPMKDYARVDGLRMGASFDYRCADGDAFGFTGKPGIIECKNVDGLIYKRKWMDDETPAHIEIQLQDQMEVSRYEWGAVAALVGGNKLVMYVRARDPQVGAAIRRKVEEFWRTVEAGEAPPPVYPDDAEYVIALNQFSDGSSVDLRDNPDAEALIAEFDECKATEKRAAARAKVLQAQILTFVGEAGSALWSGGKLSLTQVADNPGKEVTPDMVGTIIGARKGYRLFRSTPKKPEEGKNQ